jgi:predicted RNA-binding protein YlxR (DUF448 family)
MADDPPFMTCVVCGKEGTPQAPGDSIGANVVDAVDHGWLEQTRDVWICPECQEAQKAEPT